MNKRTIDAVEWAKGASVDAENWGEDEEASHLRHLAEIAERASALLKKMHKTRITHGHGDFSDDYTIDNYTGDGNRLVEALDALVNEEEVERG